MYIEKFRIAAVAASSFVMCADALAQTEPKQDPMEQFVITASPLEHASDELVAPVTTLDRDEIVASGASSLGELLAHHPGITHSSFAPGASRPIIRGLDNFRVRVQENGIASHDASALSEDHGVPTDPLAAQRVEVVRGPATLRYGSEAIGGVVNIINNRIPKRLTDRHVEGEFVAGANSASDGVEGGILLDGSYADSFAWHLDSSARRSSDYEIPGSQSTQARTSLESHGFAAGGSVILPSGHIGVSTSVFESEYEIPTAEAPILIDMFQQNLALGSVFEDLSPFWRKLDLSLGYSDYTHDEIDESTGEIGSTFDNEEWEGRAEFLHAPIGGFEGAVGLHIRGRELSASGEGGELIAPSQSNAQAVFLFEELALTNDGGATLQFGARVEKIGIDGTGLSVPGIAGVETPYSRDFTPVGGSVGLLYDLPQYWTLGLTAQIVQRAPEALELFAKGPHESTETFEIGNAFLDVETARSIELSVRRKSGDIMLDVAAFFTKYDDFIYKSFTGILYGEDLLSCGVETELTQIVYTADDATFYGAEFEGTWQMPFVRSGTLSLTTQFDFVRGELNGGFNVPRMPPMRYGLGALYEREALTIEVNALRVSQQNDLGANETATKGYTLVDAGIQWALPMGDPDREVTLKISGHNLLDEDIRNHVSFKKEDVLLPGRSIRLHIVAKF